MTSIQTPSNIIFPRKLWLQGLKYLNRSYSRLSTSRAGGTKNPVLDVFFGGTGHVEISADKDGTRWLSGSCPITAGSDFVTLNLNVMIIEQISSINP